MKQQTAHPRSVGQELKRKMDFREALATHLLPVTKEHAKVCKTPVVKVDNVCNTQGYRMSGNATHPKS